MLSSPPKDEYVQANGLRLHYLDWRGDSDRVVVMVHGGTGNAHDWDGLAQSLREDYRVLSLDQRGHGDSDWSREGYWPQQLAEDLSGFVDALGLAHFDLVSQSMGAWTSIAYAGDRWEKLRHLVLTDFGPEVGRESAREIRSNITDRPLGFRGAEEAVEWLQKAYPTRPRSLLERRVQHGMRTNWARRLVWKHDPEFTWITGSAGLKATPFLWEQLARIKCSTLILRGDRSTILTPEIRDRMLAAVPHAESAEVPDCWHFLYDENPKEFTRLTQAFLATV